MTPGDWPNPTPRHRAPPRSTATTARIDATDLSTRLINLELKRLVNVEGIGEVTIVNPGAKHSVGVGILRRCKINVEGSPGWFAFGLIDGP